MDGPGGNKQQEVANCPDEWIEFKDFCYKANFTEVLRGDLRFPRYEKVTWNEGQQICKNNENSILPVIYDKESNEFIKSKFVYNGGTFKDSWIGASKMIPDSKTWVWQDGDGVDGILDSMFTAWHSKDFENGDGCAYINGHGKWLSMNTARCSSNHLNDVRYLVCQLRVRNNRDMSYDESV